MPDTVEEYMFVFRSAKSIDPFHHTEGDEMDCILIPYFVSAFGHGLKINIFD
jgi:hypothetical protein